MYINVKTGFDVMIMRRSIDYTIFSFFSCMILLGIVFLNGNVETIKTVENFNLNKM